MSDCFVYLILNTRTKRAYVGATKAHRQRFHQHRHDLRNGTHANALLQSDWDDLGADCFAFLTVERVFDQEDLRGAEERWLAEYKHDVYNAARHSSIWNRGAKMPPMSQETRDKMSASQTGRKHSDETKRKVSEARKGMKFSESHKANMSKAMMGKKHALGNKWSEASKDAFGKAVVVTDPEGNQTEYPRIVAAANAIGHERANMIRILRGGGMVKRGAFKGWKFAYA